MIDIDHKEAKLLTLSYFYNIFSGETFCYNARSLLISRLM